MHIAIDASRTTAEHLTGTETYALAMIRALIDLNETLDQPHTLTLYFRDKPAPNLFAESDFVRYRVLSLPRLWTHVALAAAVSFSRADVLWVPAHTLPFLFRGRGVVTVHDVGYRLYPTAHKLGQRVLLELYTAFSAWRATHIMTDSHATLTDMTRFYRTPKRKMSVVYPGVTRPLVSDLNAVREKYGIPPRYFLYVGTLQPRKNIAHIVGAFQQWQALTSGKPTALVLAGGKGWKFSDHWVTGANVIQTGYIDEADKGALMAGAIALIFPSFYEGFGFPVLEAMSVGTPVICADNSSLPEVGGDAAFYTKANNVMLTADRMEQLTTTRGLREQLIQRGYAQAEQFTWEQAARDALAVLEQAVQR